MMMQLVDVVSELCQTFTPPVEKQRANMIASTVFYYVSGMTLMITVSHAINNNNVQSIRNVPFAMGYKKISILSHITMTTKVLNWMMISCLTFPHFRIRMMTKDDVLFVNDRGAARCDCVATQHMDHDHEFHRQQKLKHECTNRLGC